MLIPFGLIPHPSKDPCWRNCLASLAILASGFLAAPKPTVAAAPDLVTPELLIVARETTFYVVEGDKLVRGASLPPKTLLKTSPRRSNPRIPMADHFCPVTRLEPCPAPDGWIDCRNAFNLYSGTEKRLPFVYTDSRPPDWILPRIPAIIKRQPEHVQKAWIDVETTLALMTTMIKDKSLTRELPEPYFARAQLLHKVGNHEDALRDYLRAAQLVKTSRQDLVDYSRYFIVLVNELHERTRIPRPIVSTRIGYSLTRGQEFYFSRNLDRALIYFDDAVQVETTNPLNWYFRALTYKKLGREELALRDAIIGADLERINRKDGVHWLGSPSDIDLGLERIQGSLRMWLSSVRDGDPVLKRSALRQSRRE